MKYLYARVVPSLGWTVFCDRVPIHNYEHSCSAALHVSLANAATGALAGDEDADKLRLWLTMRTIMKERGTPC